MTAKVKVKQLVDAYLFNPIELVDTMYNERFVNFLLTKYSDRNTLIDTDVEYKEYILSLAQ